MLKFRAADFRFLVFRNCRVKIVKSVLGPFNGCECKIQFTAIMRAQDKVAIGEGRAAFIRLRPKTTGLPVDEGRYG